MPMTLEQATYHLGYELKGEQPVISLHTDLANLANLQYLDKNLVRTQTYLGINSPFTYELEAFGFEGVGTIDEPACVAGWVALRLALPKRATGSIYYGSPTPEVLPIVATLSVVLGHLKQWAEGKTDPDNPQLVIAGLSNRTPLNEYYSSPVKATITPAALKKLATLSDLKAAEERVRQALFASFQYPYGHALDEDFRVSLGNDVSFDYPGDGTGFFASRIRDLKTEGLILNAANNDYPIQQVGILGGLAALNTMLLEHNRV
jgi:hypothetical protein